MTSGEINHSNNILVVQGQGRDHLVWGLSLLSSTWNWWAAVEGGYRFYSVYGKCRVDAYPLGPCARVGHAVSDELADGRWRRNVMLTPTVDERDVLSVVGEYTPRLADVIAGAAAGRKITALSKEDRGALQLQLDDDVDASDDGVEWQTIPPTHAYSAIAELILPTVIQGEARDSGYTPDGSARPGWRLDNAGSRIHITPFTLAWSK